MVSSQGRTAAALSVALQHPTVSSDPKNICKLLQTCKSWRAAVQQSSAGLTDIKLSCNFQAVEQPLRIMSSFSAWLPKCLGLVRRLEIIATKFCRQQESAAVLAAAETLLALSLQAGGHQLLQCASIPGTAMAAQLGPRLQLQQYSSNVLTGCRVISALPAAALTSLALSNVGSDSALTAVSRLTALQHLNLDALLVTELPDLSMLHRLNDLHLSGFAGSCYLADLSGFTGCCALAELPVQLQQLTVCPADGSFVADLQYLQQLQILNFEVYNAATEIWTLPAQLQQLTITCVGDPQPLMERYHVSCLHQLEQLELDGTTDSGEQLLSAATMPQLQHLSMKYYNEECLQKGAAQAWCRVPQLHELYIDFSDGIERDNFWQLLHHVAAVSQLRKLEITSVIEDQVPGVQEAMDEGLCNILSSITLLHDLQLVVWNMPGMESYSQDLLHLTALTRLTRLQLREQQLDATVATSLALELTNLQRLTLDKSQLDWCVSSLPAINKLTRLTHLQCSTFSDIQARRGLSLLTGLTSLKELKGFDVAGHAAITEFWATLKHQRH